MQPLWRVDHRCQARPGHSLCNGTTVWAPVAPARYSTGGRTATFRWNGNPAAARHWRLYAGHINSPLLRQHRMSPQSTPVSTGSTDDGSRFLLSVRTCCILAFAIGIQLFATLAFAGADQATWHANCGASGGCHSTPPSGAQLNGAGSTAVISAANTSHGMTRDAFLSAGSNLADMAAYLATQK